MCSVRKEKKTEKKKKKNFHRSLKILGIFFWNFSAGCSDPFTNRSNLLLLSQFAPFLTLVPMSLPPLVVVRSSQ